MQYLENKSALKRFWLTYILVTLCFGIIRSQECPDLTNPIQGTNNVPVNTTISWEPVTGVTGYIISIGTTSGGSDIVNQQAVGSSTSYTPPLGLPDNTTLYVTITLFFFDQPDIECSSQSFTTENVTVPPDCTSMINPVNAAVDVAVATNISWSYAYGATGYFITIGTAPGLGNIQNNLDVGNVLFYNPPADFANDTQIFVEITPYNENGNAIGCIEESFTTGNLGTLPDCSTIISPVNGEVNVGLSPFIEWTSVPDATGYIVNIGSTPFNNDVLDAGVFFTNSTFVINFEPNSVYFIEIIPFNAAGEAIGCSQTSFSTILGCGPFFDALTGDLVTLNPELTLPDEIGLCLNETPLTISAPDQAEGYRWYKLNANNDFVVISENITVDIFEVGTYKYEAYNYADGDDGLLECPSEKEFTVVASNIATIIGATVNDGVSGLDIEILVEGIGDYEYALDHPDGPYQDSNLFISADENTSFAFVRDKNGCGIVSINIQNYIPQKGFPKFFTPNNDGFNDYWQYRPNDDDDFIIQVIYIFDRYGKLLKALNPDSIGWNGRLNDYEIPNSDFWYLAEATNGLQFKGHFTLKR